MKNKIFFDLSIKRKPYSYQLEAIEYIKSKEWVALFDEQGTGKTKIVIDSLLEDIKNGFIQTAIIVCKKHLIYTWKNEFEVDTNIEPIIISGGKNKRGSQFMGLSHFYIIGYETLISEQKRLELLLKLQKSALILDESQKIKNPDSKIYRSVIALGTLAHKRVIISGTPISNRPIDLWSQFFFLDSGRLLGTDFNIFKKKYGLNLKGTKISKFSSKFDSLKEIIIKNSIRRLKDNVLTLPNKIYIVKIVELNNKQKKIYEKLKNELIVEIKSIGKDRIIDESNNIFKKLLRLTQIASNPFLLDKTYTEDPAKFKLLDTLIHDIIKKHEKVIIWTSFVENILILKSRYSKYGSLTLYGGMSIEERDKSIKKFNNDATYKVLIANPTVAKEGLTLTSANNAIYLDRNFKLDDYLQSQDRIHRISQNKICYITKIIANNTIDMYIDEILEKKNLISKYIYGDIKKLKDNDSYLTKEDLLRMIG